MTHRFHRTFGLREKNFLKNPDCVVATASGGVGMEVEVSVSAFKSV
jgi:hypothetical protein